MLNMNTVKSYKFILLITAVIISFAIAFATMSFGVAKADVLPSNYFEYGKSTTATFKNNNAVFSLTEDDTVKVKKEIAVNDFSVDLKLGTGIKKVEIVVSADSYFASGNKNAEGKLDTTVKNIVPVTASGKVEMKVGDDGFYDVTVGGVAQADITDIYYRVAPSNDYNVLTGNVEFKVTLNENVETADFEIVSMSQKASDDTFLQTFVLTDGALTEAKPVISIANTMKVIDDGGVDKVVMYDKELTKVNYTVHSFLNGNVKSNTAIKANGYVNESNNGDVHFNTSVTEFQIVDKTDNTKVFSTVKVKVLDHTVTDDVKPEYIDNADALEAFKQALKGKYTVVKVDDNGTPDDASDDVTTEHSVAIGTKITIPSLKDLVKDNYTSYESLSYTVYYATPESSSFASKTSMELTLNSAGKYVFFVAFTDEDGNKMEKSQFIKEEDGSEDVINMDAGAYGKYVFEFFVEDNAPITITPAKEGKGYKGSSYTASKFTVDATGCTITYKLFYNSSLEAKATDSGWVEIPKASDITDKSYNKDGYTYSKIQSIAYNGSLTFTPDKIGSYKIECTANSKTTAREATESTIVRIQAESKVVKPASDWLENNVWSVVFLSIGTLCLIGIIVLLCIKPKDVKED